MGDVVNGQAQVVGAAFEMKSLRFFQELSSHLSLKLQNFLQWHDPNRKQVTGLYHFHQLSHPMSVSSRRLPATLLTCAIGDLHFCSLEALQLKPLPVCMWLGPTDHQLCFSNHTVGGKFITECTSRWTRRLFIHIQENNHKNPKWKKKQTNRKKEKNRWKYK